MNFENVECREGEVFLGTYLERQVASFDQNLAIRQARAYNRGVCRYWNLYVMASELSNYLRQAEADLQEERLALEEQKKLLEEMDNLYKDEPADQLVFDELCLGVFPSACSAKRAFPYFDSIRGGSFARYETREVKDERGEAVDLVDVPMFYFFVEKGEYLERLQTYMAIFATGAENYECMESFYNILKSIEDIESARIEGG